MKWREMLLGAVVVCVIVGSAAQSAGPAAPSRQEAFKASYQYETAQNYTDAIKAMLPLYQSSSRDYLVNLRLGWLYYLGGAYANSQKHYQAASLAEARAVEPRVGCLLPLLAQGRYADAEVVAHEALRLDADNYYASLRLAYALRMQSKYSAAEAVNRRMLKLYPSDSKFLLEQGYAYWGLGRMREARELFADVLLLDPENYDARTALGGLAER